MLNKKLMILTFIIISLFAVSAVSAADNASCHVNDSFSLEIQADDGLSATDDDNLTASAGTFTDLANEIANAKSELNLKRNYIYSDADSAYKEGIEITKEITINGNGFSIDGSQFRRAFVVSHENVVLNNIMFTNSNHGAIMWDGANGKLTNCDFRNLSSSVGGAVYWYGSGGSISNCSFLHCSASSGGAVYFYGDDSILTDCSFKYCFGTYMYDGRSYGGAVDWKGNNGILRDCAFMCCGVIESHSTYGGAVCWEGLHGVLTDCRFWACFVSGVSAGAYSDYGASYGGAVYWDGDEGSLSNCYFEDCAAARDYRVSPAGSAVYWIDDNGILSNSTFANFNVEEGNVVNYFGDGCSLIDCDFIDCNAFDDSNIINWESYASEGTLKDCSFIACSVEDGEVICGINGTNCKFLEKVNISASSAKVNYGEDATISVNLSGDATGDITFTVDDEIKTVKISKGTVKCTFSGITGGMHDVLVYYSGDGRYASRSIKTYIEVIRLKPSISVSSTGAKYGENATVTVNLANDASGNVQFKINGLTYDAQISKGLAECTVSNLNHGSYDVMVLYSGNYKYGEAQAKTTFVIDKNSPISSVVVDDVGYGDNATVIVGLARNVTGNVEIAVGSTSKKVKITDDVASAVFSGLKCGSYDVEVKYAGDLNYISQTEKTSFDVFKGTPIVSVVALDVSYGETEKIIVEFKDGVNGYLNVTVNGKTERIRISDSKVIYTLTGLEIGLYKVIVHYGGNDNYNPQTVEDSFNVTKAKSVLTASPVTTVYNGNKYLVVSLRDGQDNVIGGATVTVVLDEKTYTPTTDANGQVKISTNGLKPVKTYAAKINFAGNSKYDKSSYSANIVVKKANIKLAASSKTLKRTDKTKKYLITLKTNQNKFIKNAKVTIKVNKITYSATTNAKGQATFKLTKLTKKGKYTGTITYKGNAYYNKLTKNVKITIK